ncbi:glutathione S-transferase family protein [Primorskyibacter sp. S187A]|uniref:glutathione S-transferase family protein n=1 Tax=Primorskyibacter sp. S187A TaxID=3415130 RepID=UPI003C7AC1C3
MGRTPQNAATSLKAASAKQAVAFRVFSRAALPYVTAMAYRLHYAPDNASLIIRLALELAEVPFETLLVDRRVSAQHSADFRALNPQGQIPALETPDGPLFETGAILCWLSERHAELGPAPGTALRGRFLSWLFMISNTLHPALRQTFYADRFIAADLMQDLRHGLQTEIRRALDLLNIEAARGDVMGASPLTVLDIYVGACLRWLRLYPVDKPGLTDLEPWPNLSNICLQLDAHPACARVAAAEGLGPHPFSAPDLPTPPEGSAT